MASGSSVTPVGSRQVVLPHIKRDMGRMALETLLRTPTDIYTRPQPATAAQDTIWQIEDWTFQLSRFPNERNGMMEYKFDLTRPDGSSRTVWVKPYMQALEWAKRMAEYEEEAPVPQPLPPIPVPAGYGQW